MNLRYEIIQKKKMIIGYKSQISRFPGYFNNTITLPNMLYRGKINIFNSKHS